MSRQQQLRRCARQASAYAAYQARQHSDRLAPGDEWRAIVAHYSALAIPVVCSLLSLVGVQAAWSALG